MSLEAVYETVRWANACRSCMDYGPLRMGAASAASAAGSGTGLTASWQQSPAELDITLRADRFAQKGYTSEARYWQRCLQLLRQQQALFWLAQLAGPETAPERAAST